jgi:hypothetical protein
MASLEYVVRPWQSPNSHGAVVIPSARRSSHEKATLTWGAKATMPKLKTQGINVIVCNEDSTETKRDGETVRITGNDPDNWIDVFRANKLYLNKKDKTSKTADDWDQFSGKGLEFTDTLIPFASHFVDAPTTTTDKPDTCKQTLTLNNNTTGA